MFLAVSVLGREVRGERHRNKLLVNVEKKLVVFAALLTLRSLSGLLHMTCSSTLSIDLKAHIPAYLITFDGAKFAFFSDLILCLSSVKGDNLGERKLDRIFKVILVHH